MEIGGRTISNLTDAGDPILPAESSNDRKRLLMKVKEESAKAGLHLNIKETKNMTTEEIHNFNINREDIEIVRLLILVHSSIQMETAAKKSLEV